MKNNARFPLFPVFVSYVVGIVLASHAGAWPPHSWAYALLIPAWASWLFHLRRITILLISLTALYLGGSRFEDAGSVPVPPGSPPPGVLPGAQTYEGVVASYPSRTVGGFSATVELSAPIRNGRARIFISGERFPARGDRIRFRAALRSSRNYGNEGEWNVEAYSRTREIDFRGTVGSSYDWKLLSHEASWLQSRLTGLRNDAIDRAEAFMGRENGALFASLVLGDQGGVSNEWIRAFRNSGILHLLVVSGSHVALVAWLGSLVGAWLFRRSSLLLRWIPIWHIRSVFGALAAVSFCLLTDLPIPTARALAGVLLGILLFTLGRRFDGWAVLMVCAFGVLLSQPLYLFDVSAQLSFAAVAGILLAIRFDRKGRRAAGLKTLLIASVGAYVATLPILAFHFHQITLLSLLPNLIFVPLLGGAGTAVGLAATFLSGPLEPFGSFLLCVLDELLFYALPAIRFFASLPGADVWVPVPSLWILVGYSGLLGAGIMPGRFTWSRVGVALASLAMIGLPYLNESRLERLRTDVTFLSVGEGDAAILHSRDGSTVVVDTGTGGPDAVDIGERVLLPWLRAKGYRRIDVLVLSHDDLDHVGGVPALLRDADVREVWVAGPVQTRWMKDLLATAQEKEIEWRDVSASSSTRRIGDFDLKILHPPRDSGSSGGNNRSMVLMAESGRAKFLFTGDLQAAGEEALMRRTRALHADILKVGHHGSKTSSSAPFLNAVRPKEAVLSVGFVNRFHHPSPVTLKSLIDRKIRVRRTDESGQVVFRFQDGDFQVFTGRVDRNSV